MNTPFFLGQIVLGGYFTLAGIMHFTKSKDMIGYAAYKGLPMPKASVYLSGAILFLGGLGVLTQKYLLWSYLGLIMFLIIAAVTVHNFWTAKDPQAKMQDRIQFQKNLAIAAALLMLIAPLI